MPEFTKENIISGMKQCSKMDGCDGCIFENSSADECVSLVLKGAELIETLNSELKKETELRMFFERKVKEMEGESAL